MYQEMQGNGASASISANVNAASAASSVCYYLLFSFFCIIITFV